MTRVGFIGLGNQGAPIARRISHAGFPLTIWARRAKTVRAFQDTAATIADSPADVASASDVVGICVLADRDVKDVVLGPEGVLAGSAPGTVIAVHSTTHPDTMAELAGLAAEHGVFVIDAPVTGGAEAATHGKLVVLAAGEPEHIARCRPVFEAFAGTVITLGGVGSAQTAKLINNLVVTAHLAIATEVYAFAEQMGVPPEAMAGVLRVGSGSSHAAAFLADCGFDLGDLKDRTQQILGKDVDITLALAESRGAPRPQVLVDTARHFVKPGQLARQRY